MSGRYLRLTLESVPQGLAVLSPDLRVTWVNNRLLSIFHLKIPPVGEPIAEVLGVKGLDTLMAEVFATGDPKSGLHLEGIGYEGPETFRFGIGRLTEMDAEAALLLSVEPVGEAERRRLDEQRHAAARQLRGFIDHSPLGMFRITPDGRFTAPNPALAAMLGFDSIDDLADQELARTFLDPDEFARFVAAVSAAGALTGFEAEWYTRDREPLRVRLSGRRVRGGRIEVVAEDVTAAHAREEQRQLTLKMEALSRFARGLAHDFNNLLTVVLGYGSVLQSENVADETRRKGIDQILQAGERASVLTDKLLALARKQTLEPRFLHLNELLRDLGELIERLAGEEVEVHAELQPGIGHVKADAEQIEQVVLNLVTNARDAMPEGGRLTLETSLVTLGPDGEPAPPGVEPGPYVLFSVRDTGVGMDAATQARAFEPFFTTGPRHLGKGLGLATVYGVVDQSGGHVSLTSAPGAGTTVRVYLPAATAPVDVEPKPEPPPVAGGTGTILVVDDEETMRVLARELLEARGYRVIEAESGEAALAVLACDTADLVLLDIVMPGLSGIELAERLHEQHPDLPIVFMSGGEIPPDVPALPKPFREAALLAVVGEGLSG